MRLPRTCHDEKKKNADTWLCWLNGKLRALELASGESEGMQRSKSGGRGERAGAKTTKRSAERCCRTANKRRRGQQHEDAWERSASNTATSL
eukprot:6204415-Pleurochrysis_carterae.AAC.1